MLGLQAKTPDAPRDFCPSALKTPEVSSNTCMTDWSINLFKEAGCTLGIEADISMPRTFRMLEKGQYDLVIGITPTPDRRSRFLFSDPILQQSIILMARKDSIQSKEINAICDAVMQSSRMIRYPDLYLGDRFDALTSEESDCFAEIISLSGAMAKAAKLLVAGRADLAPASLQGWRNMQKEEPDLMAQLTLIDLVLDQTPLSIAFTKMTQPSLIETINDLIPAYRDTLEMCFQEEPEKNSPE